MKSLKNVQLTLLAGALLALQVSAQEAIKWPGERMAITVEVQGFLRRSRRSG